LPEKQMRNPGGKISKLLESKMASRLLFLFSRFWREKPPTILCAICSKPIVIEAAKTNADGQPVHEECYFQKIIQKRIRDGYA